MPAVDDKQSLEVKDHLFSKRNILQTNQSEQLLEQYKLCVEMADRVSSRRQSANSFYLTISSLLLGSMALLGGEALGLMDTAIVSIVGICFCVLWLRNIETYTNLNRGKFAVILEIEKFLVCSPFDAEWHALGRGKKSWLYRPFRAVESLIPKLFVFLYVTLILREWYLVQETVGSVIK